jgi:hypothetical protein
VRKTTATVKTVRLSHKELGSVLSEKFVINAEPEIILLTDHQMKDRVTGVIVRWSVDCLEEEYEDDR